jgi:hypothetical protein
MVNEELIIKLKYNNEMKHIKSYISTILAAGLLLFAACENDAIDPLDGKYPAPETYTLSGLVSQDMAKEATTRIFTLKFGSLNEFLNVQFVGPRLSYFLPAGNYTIAARSVARAGNYIAGDADGGTYWQGALSGSTATPALKLTDGTISVALDGDTYTITGTVMLEDKTIIKIAYTGAIVFEPDPVAYTYTLEVTKPYSWTADGTTFNEVAGSQLNKITVSAEGIPLAYFEIVTGEDPTSLTGEYQVKAVNSLENAIVQGQFMNLLWLGIADVPIESGSYYLDGETKMFIRNGTINITDNAGVLTIAGSGLGIQDISTQMSFGDLPTPGSVNYQEATPATPSTVALTYTLETAVPAMGGTMGNEPIADSKMNRITVLADGVQTAYFEVITAADATSLAGEYVVTDGINATGQATNGYQLPAAWGGMSGGCYYIANNEKMFIRAGGGNISITDNGGVLTITGANLPILDVAAVEASGGATWSNLPDAGSVNYQNVAPDGGGGGGDVVTLTNVLSASALDNSMFGGSGYTVTLKIGEAGVTAEAGAYGVTIGGNGNYVSIDFKRDAGTLLPGTYNIKADAEAAVGDAIAGYANPYGAGYWGSVWGTATDDVTAEVPITGGTVDVAESGGIYTITVNVAVEGGESISAVYTGAITIP